MNSSQGEFELYEVEKILNHRKLPNGKLSYFVKWQGYDSSHNSWEPEHHFASLKMVLDYHDERKKAKAVAKGSKIKIDQDKLLELDEQLNNTIQYMEHKMNNDNIQQTNNVANDNEMIALKRCQFLNETEIDSGFIPEKVLNIFHVKNDIKNLVANIQFKGHSKSAYVPASWANQHCAQMVIEFYESRIYWQKKSSDELVKANYQDANIA